MSRMALAPGRAREYETIYVLRPTVDKEAVGVITTRMADVIKGQRGHLTEMEFWGRRRLAYPIQRHHRGVYLFLKYLGGGQVVSELERQLRLSDSVIRYQTIMVRDNVEVEGVALGEAALDLDIELSVEPDEPEMTRERELGLDGTFHDRDRRGRRDDRDRQAVASDEEEGGETAPLDGGEDVEGDEAEDEGEEG